MTQRTVLTTILASLVLALPAITHAAEPSQVSGHPTRCESPYRKKPVPPKQLQAIVESHGQWLEHREKPEHRLAIRRVPHPTMSIGSPPPCPCSLHPGPGPVFPGSSAS